MRIPRLEGKQEKRKRTKSKKVTCLLNMQREHEVESSKSYQDSSIVNHAMI